MVMLRDLFAALARNRFGFPLIVAGALVILTVNEVTYRAAVRTLDWGIALTDARIEASRALQLLTDAETAQRGFLLTGKESYLTTYRAAAGQLPTVVAPTLAFLRAHEGVSRTEAAELRATIAARLAVLEQAIALKREGNESAAVDLVESGVGKRYMNAIRVSFDAALDSAANMQSGARISLYQSLFVNRIAVLTLTLLAVLGLYLFMRQVRALARERIAYSEQLEREVIARTDDLRALATHAMSVREDERRRLARELHDELGGLLTAAKLDLARVRNSSALPPDLAERIRKVNERIDGGISLKRRIIEDLHPSSLEQLGLTASLRVLCQDAAEGLGIEVEQALGDVDLPPDEALTVYRLVQEALTNIRKYARAHRVVVRLDTPVDGLVHVSVQDDGIGFDVQAAKVGRHGLAGMRYRVEAHGGIMQMTSRPGLGTTVTASVPVAAVPLEDDGAP
jgi:signal transduction histidine kinase